MVSSKELPVVKDQKKEEMVSSKELPVVKDQKKKEMVLGTGCSIAIFWGVPLEALQAGVCTYSLHYSPFTFPCSRSSLPPPTQYCLELTKRTAMQSRFRGPEDHISTKPESLSPHLESLASPLTTEKSGSEQAATGICAREPCHQHMQGWRIWTETHVAGDPKKGE